MKKLFSIILAALILLSAVSTGAGTLVVFADDLKTGDQIMFGSYPQSRVTDAATLSKLNSIQSAWKSFEYYRVSALGVLESAYGLMTSSDFMKYRDISLDGVKYRAVLFDEYRPSRSSYVSSEDSSFQDDNGYNAGTTYWFRFEPISWRVLDPSKGLVLAETIIDAQEYNHFLSAEFEKEYWGNADHTYYASNYAESSIREWLNGDLYNTAFTDSQKNNIKTTHLENKSKEVSKYGSPDTDDKIFLLSYYDTINPAYGFSSDDSSFDTEKSAKGSDYAKAQGLYVSDRSGFVGNSYWWLRTAFEDQTTTPMGYDGRSNAAFTDANFVGIRPACVLEKLDFDETPCAHTKTRTVEIVVPANCKNNGSYEKVVYCADCGKELSRMTKTTLKTNNHKYKVRTKQATMTENGKKVRICAVCGVVESSKTIYKASNVCLKKTKYVYSGKVIRPKVVVEDSKGNSISTKNYTLKWSNSDPKKIGKYSVTVIFKADYSGRKKLTFSIIPGQVKGLKAAKVNENSIMLKWTKVTGAKYYAVQYSKDGKKWSDAAKVVSSANYTVNNLKAGIKYYFRVKAFDGNKKISGKYSAVLKTGTLCAAPVVALKSTKSKTATASWKKVTGAKSYIVSYSRDNKDWKNKTVTGTALTLSKLTGGKKIYVKVVAVNAFGKKSAFSAVKAVTVKK